MREMIGEARQSIQALNRLKEERQQLEKDGKRLDLLRYALVCPSFRRPILQQLCGSSLVQDVPLALLTLLSLALFWELHTLMIHVSPLFPHLLEQFCLFPR